jgi:hypothetical protein
LQSPAATVSPSIHPASKDASKETLMNPLLMRTVCALASTLITLVTLQGIDSLAKPSQTDPRIAAAGHAHIPS